MRAGARREGAPLRRLLVILAAVVAAFAAAESWGLVQEAHAMATYPQLNAVASVFAERPIQVECATKEEDPELMRAWGYTMPQKVGWVRVDDRLCAAALGDGTDLFQALGIKVIVHESLHQRIPWSARGNEGKVECAAIRHFKVAAMLLGRTPDEADRLLPFALFWYYQQTTIPAYAYKACVPPFWLPPADR